MSEILREVKQRLCEILKIELNELDSLIEETKKKYGVNDTVAIIQIVTKKGLIDVAGDVIRDLILKENLIRISKLRVGMRGVTIIGRVEVIKIFEEGAKFMAMMLLSDGVSLAQIYVPNTVGGAAINNIAINDVVIIIGVNVVTKLKSGIFKLTVSDDGEIMKLDPDKYKLLLDVLPPQVNILDVEDINGFIPSDKFMYFHVKGVLMKVFDSQSSFGSRRSIAILLGSLKTYCKDKILCVMYDRAIDEFRRNNFKVGDIVVMHGVFLKFRGDKKQIVARNMTTMEKESLISSSIDEIPEGGYSVFRLSIRSPPKIRIYSKLGEECRFATFLAEISSRVIVRVVVWNEELLDIVNEVKSGDVIEIFGQVKSGMNFREIHVHRNIDRFEILERSGEERKATRNDILTQISEFRLGMYVDIVLRLEEVKEIRSQKLAGVALLTDGNNNIRMLIWDEDLLDLLSNLVGSLVIVKNVRVIKERDSENMILATTRYSEAFPLAKSFSYWLPKEYVKRTGRINLISYLVLNEPTFIYGEIVKIEWIGKMYFCGKCGGIIIDPEKRICEMGHVADVIDKNVVSLIIDDGFGETNAIVPSKDLGLLGGGTEEINDRLIGKSICLYGQVKLDYSTGVPTRIFLADKLYGLRKMEAYLGVLSNLSSVESKLSNQ